MRRFIGLFLALAVLMGLAGPAWSHPCPSGCPCEGPGMGPRHDPDGFGKGMSAILRCILGSEDLNLSPDQRDSIETILDEGRKEGRRLRQEKRESKEQFIKTFSDPKVTDSQIRDIAKAMRKLREAMEDHRLEVLLKVRSVLTPDQLKNVPAAMDKCRPGPGWHRD